MVDTNYRYAFFGRTHNIVELNQRSFSFHLRAFLKNLPNFQKLPAILGQACQLPANFVILLLAIFLPVIFFTPKIFLFYSNYRLAFSYYFTSFSIFFLVAIIFYATKSFRFIKDLFSRDPFVPLFIGCLFLMLIGLILAGPVLVRVDKDISAVLGSLNFNLDGLSSFSILFRAKAFFFFMNGLSYVIPINVRSISIINSLLMVFQMLLVYFCLKLLVKQNWLAFLVGLLFVLYPNNFLLGRAPDYVFAGQAFGTLSLFSLLLFFKHKARPILFLSLSALGLSLLLRIE